MVTMIEMVLCKINEEINHVSVFHNHVSACGPDLIAQSTGKTPVKS